jgi:hypothetical protein
MILLASVSVSFAGTVNVTELAGELGFDNIQDIESFGISVPTTKYQKKKLFDEKLYRRVLQIHSRIKDFNQNNYLPRSAEARRYSNALRTLKYQMDHYFKIRREVIAARKNEKRKRDVYTLLKNHGLSTDHDQLRLFGDKIYQPSAELLRDDSLYKKIQALYLEIENSEKKDFDRSDSNRRMLVEVVFGMLASRMRVYLEARDDLDKAQLAVEKQKSSAGQRLIETYASTAAPSMLPVLKEMVSKIKEWKVLATKDVHHPRWNVMARDGSGDSENLVFVNPPLDPAAYKDRYLIIQATITRTIEDKYLISPIDYSAKALAKIPDRIISASDARFHQEVLLLCRLVDVIDGGNIFDSPKPVALVEVDKIVSKTQYDAFSRYVAGHPDEFPQNKYVRIKISDGSQTPSIETSQMKNLRYDQ